MSLPLRPSLPLRSVCLHLLALFALLPAMLSAAVPAAPGAPAAERFPLDHYLTGLAEQQWRERGVRMAAIQTAAAARARGEYIRSEILKGLGGLPERREALNARVTGTLERDGYRVEKVIYESLPGSYVTANLYVPTRGRGPFPAVLGAAGHAMPEGKGAEAYQRAWIGLVRHGYVVLAYDPPAQGERFERLDAATGVMTSGSHISPGLQCLLTGGTVARYFLWDGIRGLDYLLTRPEVDPKRIAAAGNSGGGTQSAFLAVVEPRLAAAAPACYWTSWPELWHPAGPQDSEQVIPGFIKAGLDFSDLAIAFAPRPVTMLTATKDSFPIKGARAMHAEARRIFALLGAGEQMGFFEYDDGHGWSQPRREACIAWFNRWLQDRHDPVKEGEMKIETLADLQCTDDGQVMTSLRSKNTQMLNLEVAEEMYPRRTLRTVSRPDQARATVAARLAIPASRAKPTARPLGRSARTGFEVETVALVPEPGVELRVEVVSPTGTAAARPAVIVLREYLAPVDPETDAEVAAWRKAGYIVVLPQLRGLLPQAETRPYYTIAYRTAMRALLLGKTLTGMRVQDLLAVFDFASARPGVAADRIVILGRGNMGVVAQHAAALEPKIERVIADGALLSYLNAVRTPYCRETVVESILPGVLLDYDLPDLATLSGPGRVVLANPVSAINEKLSAADARAAFGESAHVLVTDAPITPDLLPQVRGR